MKDHEMIWATLLHLGTNMWRDKDAPPLYDDRFFAPATGTIWSDDLQFDLDVFHKVTEKLPELGINTVMIDVGDGMRYDSHPEIGVNGALTPDELRGEVRRLRALGLEPVPKLNFSAGHDAWMGQYERMLSTDIYRTVVGDLIHEICDVFEKPKYLHLGMDEERAENQGAYGYSVIRASECWWRDFYHMVDCCEKENARPWIWSDRFWHHPDDFAKNMPKTVLQSNWHYWKLMGEGGFGGPNGKSFRAFYELEELGFEQVPTTTTWSHIDNTRQVMATLAESKMKNIVGFMTAPWMLTLPQDYYDILGDVARLGFARKKYGNCFE